MVLLVTQKMLIFAITLRQIEHIISTFIALKMKKLTFLLIALLTALTVNAQLKGYVCTGDHVNIRTGAGVKYPVMDEEFGHKRQLAKGDVVLDRGQQKNGFCLVNGPLQWGGDERDGWVSQQYLRPVTICPTCGGTKQENIATEDIDLATCHECNGKGYIKSSH
jgi:hypothetical protein